MYKPTFTQSDLKSALQKLTGAPFVAVKLEVQPRADPRADPSVEELQHVPAPPPDILDKERQIENLKEIVKQLSEKVEEAKKPTHDQLSHRELKEAKEKQLALEAEIARQERTRAILVEQLKNSRDVLPLQKELERVKLTAKELSETLAKRESELEIYKEELSLPKPVATGFEELEAELQEQKNRIIRFMSEKKELEAKLSFEACEKATLLARLHELSRKQEHKEELLFQIKEIQEEKAALELKLLSLQIETAKLEHERVEASKLLEKTTREFKESQERVQALQKETTAYTQELAVSRGCVIDRQQALEAEQKALRELKVTHDALQHTAQETLTQKQLIEQHLARRVKECALLERKMDEETHKLQLLQENYTQELQKSAQLEATLDQLKKNEEYMRQEYLQKCASYEDRLAKQYERYDALLSQNQAYLQELSYLRKMQERLQQLEKLHVQFSQIVATPLLPPPIFSSIPLEAG